MSRDEFDIIQTLVFIQKKLKLTNFYFLLSSDMNNEYISTRLESMGIFKVKYNIPVRASKEQRILALSCVFEDMLSKVSSGFCYDDEINSQVTLMKQKQQELNKNTVLCIGLVAKNTVIEPLTKNEEWIGFTDSFTPMLKRYNTKAVFYTEAGGPAYIVAKLLSEFGIHADIVAKIANDNDGDFIYGEMKQSKLMGLDFLNIVNHEGNETSTWTSSVLIDGIDTKEPGCYIKRQRVFLDNKYNENDDLAPQIKTKMIRYLNEYNPRIIFFDKFYRNAVKDVLLQAIPYKSNIWTIYETGGRGDKNYTSDMSNIRVSMPYFFENEYVNKKVNICIASFTFARDFLWRYQSYDADNFYNEHDDKESVGTLLAALTNRSDDFVDSLEQQMNELHLSSDIERKIIHDLVNNSGDLELFVNMVAHGANRWLKPSEPRIVIITLHEYGCIWISLSGNTKSFELFYGYVDTSRDDSSPWYTNSVGDIYRGAITAGFSAYYEKYSEDLRLKNKLKINEAITNICKMANRIAFQKIHHPTFKAILGDVKKIYTDWIGRIS